MGMHDEGSIHYGYDFEILNTFEMGLLKKMCSHIPSRMDQSQTPGSGRHARCHELLSLRAGYCRLVTRAPPLTPTLEEGDKPLRWGYLIFKVCFYAGSTGQSKTLTKELFEVSLVCIYIYDPYDRWLLDK